MTHNDGTSDRQVRGLLTPGERARADVASAIDGITQAMLTPEAAMRLSGIRDRLSLIYDDLRVLFPIDA